MDAETVDQQYADLQQKGQQTAALVPALAGKLSAAATAGDANAREWQLDLKEIALGTGNPPTPFMTAKKRGAGAVWQSNKKNGGATAVLSETTAKARKIKAMPKFVEPQLAKLAEPGAALHRNDDLCARADVRGEVVPHRPLVQKEAVDGVAVERADVVALQERLTGGGI